MDVLTYGLLNKKVEEAKNVSGEKITAAVNTYLDENPPVTGATAEQAAQIDKNVADIDELKSSYDEAVTNSHVHSNKTVLDSIDNQYIEKWNNAYSHSISSHAPENAQENIIEDIKINGVSTAISDKTVNITTPTKTSDITNDSGFVTNIVNDLVNYYLKSEVYTKEEVQSLIGRISSLELIKVDALPTENIKTSVIYLVPKEQSEESNIYTEYIYMDGKWEIIGDTSVDLSQYALNKDVNKIKGDLANVQSAVSEKMDSYTIKTVMDSVATPHTQYYLGNQTAVDIVLPDTADAGQIITVCWYNGETAATLSITGTMLDFDYTPGANSRSEINALWDGLNWAVLGNEMAVVVDA